ncbi:MAG: tetratricopeptide repeat protein, partial [Bacteroidia bacterium]
MAASFCQNCCHKRRWQADEMPPPKLMNGIGKDHFPISTASDSAQLFFDQGIRLSHSYWDFEAYRAFKRAAELDSMSPMPPLGIAMVYFMSFDTTVIEGKIQMQKAKQRAAVTPCSQKEKDLVDVWSVFYLSGDPDTLVYGMRMLCAKYPDDIELQLILANQLTDAYKDGKPTPEFTSCDSLLEIILKKDPSNFAAHHYYIHNIEDTPFTEKGLNSAAVIASLAPNSGHIQHMPGHIYYHLGDYEAARTAFMNAKRTDSLYLVTSGIEPVNHWNNMHNHIYLAYADIEQGRYEEAMAAIRYLQSIETKSERLNYKTEENARAPGIADMYLALRISDWDKCIELSSAKVNLFDKWAVFAPWYRKLLFYYAHSMKAFDNKEL